MLSIQTVSSMDILNVFTARNIDLLLLYRKITPVQERAGGRNASETFTAFLMQMRVTNW